MHREKVVDPPLAGGHSEGRERLSASPYYHFHTGRRITSTSLHTSLDYSIPQCDKTQ